MVSALERDVRADDRAVRSDLVSRSIWLRCLSVKVVDEDDEDDDGRDDVKERYDDRVDIRRWVRSLMREFLNHDQNVYFRIRGMWIYG